MTKNELENLLRHGAYDLFERTTKNPVKNLPSTIENIEDILERSKVVTDAANGTENHFRKRRSLRVRPKTMKLILTTPTFGAKRLACKCQQFTHETWSSQSVCQDEKVSYNPKDFYGKDVADALKMQKKTEQEYDHDYDGTITKNLRQRILKGLREFGLGCTEAFQQSVNKKGAVSKDVIDEVCISYIALLSQVFVRTSRSVEMEDHNKQQNSDECKWFVINKHRCRDARRKTRPKIALQLCM